MTFEETPQAMYLYPELHKNISIKLTPIKLTAVSPLEISNKVCVQNYESINIKSIKILHKKTKFLRIY